MIGEDEKLLDIGSYRKLKEIEQSLKEELEARNRELIEIMNQKNEYITHLLRVVLAKVDAIDSRSKISGGEIIKPVQAPYCGKKKDRGLLRVLNNTLANFVGL